MFLPAIPLMIPTTKDHRGTTIKPAITQTMDPAADQEINPAIIKAMLQETPRAMHRATNQATPQAIHQETTLAITVPVREITDRETTAQTMLQVEDPIMHKRIPMPTSALPPTILKDQHRLIQTDKHPKTAQQAAKTKTIIPVTKPATTPKRVAISQFYLLASGYVLPDAPLHLPSACEVFGKIECTTTSKQHRVITPTSKAV